ncbi:PKD domain-containing protein [Candidatus Microgenomates bacterium]|nr:PKD domain-containing protein [Candidatus Microgenomates bacterium]
MSTRTKTIIAGVFFSLVVVVGAAVAVLTAFKQNTTAPVAPTVPQITPLATGATTTPACTLSFTVAPPRNIICDGLTASPDSGTAPLTVSFTLAGHATPSGSIVSYKFDFGDGTAPIAQANSSISHTFTAKGSFTVKGTVADELANVSPDTTACQKTINTSGVVYKYNKCETGVNNAKVCKQEDCVPNNTPCDGLSTCKTDTDCQPKYQHKVCLGNACSVVDCSPPTVQCSDSCTSDTNCQPVTPTPPATPSATHRTCQNQACVVVAGSGASTCTSDISCRPAAAPPPIPKSGNAILTIGIIGLGVGALTIGFLLLL